MISTSNSWFTGRLVRARALTSSARSLTFAVPGWPGNAAGQHVDVRLSAPDGYQAVRSYSVASVGAGDEIELAVDRLPDGEVSPFLVDEIEIGDAVEIRGPVGGWFVWRPEQTPPVQLIAGGSGVVPLVAMMRAHAESGSTVPMQLLYSLRTPEDAFFADELSESSGAMRTVWHYTRTASPAEKRPPGRLMRTDLERDTIAPELSPLIYICGSTGFVETVTRALLELGHRADSIRTERFGGI
ncbi:MULTISPECIES: FAD-binding oxidoreductase [unclassified Microbacterium]|uniref:FAD-binding oxidoreductase n=1 Tax=unclassified Microbacterium TaxID=2609290 RepID=UPI00217ECB09|nr:MULTISPECIES: FAD-binding oxidoreductase [unclassified Microbacterium]